MCFLQEGKKELDVWTDIIDAEGMKRFVLDADSPPRHATPLYTAQHDVFGGTLQARSGYMYTVCSGFIVIFKFFC